MVETIVGYMEKSYVIASQLPDKVYRKLVVNKLESHVTGLAFVAIGVLQLAGGKMSEGILTLQ